MSYSSENYDPPWHDRWAMYTVHEQRVARVIHEAERAFWAEQDGPSYAPWEELTPRTWCSYAEAARAVAADASVGLVMQADEELRMVAARACGYLMTQERPAAQRIAGELRRRLGLPTLMGSK